MKKEFLGLLLAGVAVVTMGSMTTQASILDDIKGDVKFLFDGLDSAQTTYALIGSAQVICTGGVALCDAKSAPPAAPGTNDASDSWGLTRVTAIKDQNDIFGPNLWNSGDDGEVLFTYFRGFQDIHVEEFSSGAVEIFSIGGVVDIFRVDTAFTVGTLADQAALEAKFAGEELYLTLAFTTGCSITHATATLCGEFTTDSLLLAGSSDGFANATGGTAILKYPKVFDFIQSTKACPGAICAGTSFNVEIFDGSAVTKVPEPGALGLLGLGLGLVGLGLTLNGRRRKGSR